MPVAVQEEWLQCSAVRQLQKNLGQERQAVFTFYFTFCDEVCPPPGPPPLCAAICGGSSAIGLHFRAEPLPERACVYIYWCKRTSRYIK